MDDEGNQKMYNGTMSHPYFSATEHSCDAVVLGCMDFRFWQAIVNYIQQQLGYSTFDLITEAGGTKALAEHTGEIYDDLLRELTIASTLHHIKTIILVNHEDCGGYGGKSAFASNALEREQHRMHLAQTKQILRKRYPTANVIALFAFFTQNGIDFETVE